MPAAETASGTFLLREGQLRCVIMAFRKVRSRSSARAALVAIAEKIRTDGRNRFIGRRLPEEFKAASWYNRLNENGHARYGMSQMFGRGSGRLEHLSVLRRTSFA